MGGSLCVGFEDKGRSRAGNVTDALVIPSSIIGGC